MVTNLLRLWSENPRFSEYSFVNFNELGKNDFKSKSNDYLDIYFDNYTNNVKKLFSTKKQIESLIDLLESLSSGFNNNIDEVIVCISPYLKKEGIIDKVNNCHYYYVLEGNRRVFCISVLLNYEYYDSNKNLVSPRNILLEEVSKYPKKIYDRLIKTIDNFDNSNDNNVKESLSNIDVKQINIEQLKNDEIWKILNTRHFGKRKGKLNWPRGLVLESIYERIKKFREDIDKKDEEELSEEENKELRKNIESFTGKVINTLDLKSAIFVHYCIDTYNKKTNNKEILYAETEEENENILNIEDNMENNFENIKNNKLDENFSVSSLELSMSTIKILTENGTRETLEKYLDLNIDVRKCYIYFNENLINKESFDALIFYIIELIRNKKLTTRGYDENLENEILSIIKGQKEINYLKEKVESNNIGKIDPEDISLVFLINNTEKWSEKVDLSKLNDDEIGSLKSRISVFFNQINPTINKLLKVKDKILSKQNIVNDQIFYSLIHIWFKELISIICNKNNINIYHFPVYIFCAALRSTSEIMQLWLIRENSVQIDNYLSVTNQHTNHKLNNAIDFLNSYTNNNGKQNNFTGWLSDALSSFSLKIQDNTNKRNYQIYDIYLLMIDIFQNDTYKIVNDLFKRINSNKVDKWEESYVNSISKEVCEFLEWSTKWSNCNGFRDKLHSIIHRPNLIKTIHNNTTDLKDYSENLDNYVSIVIKFLEFYMK